MPGMIRVILPAHWLIADGWKEGDLVWLLNLGIAVDHTAQPIRG